MIHINEYNHRASTTKSKRILLPFFKFMKVQEVVALDQACKTRCSTRALTTLTYLSQAACFRCFSYHRYSETSCDRVKVKSNRYLFTCMLKNLFDTYWQEKLIIAVSFVFY